jgi:hypothetical protein
MEKRIIVIGLSCLFLVNNFYGCLGNDSDGDGCYDEYDAFPNDVNEWIDSDNDGVGDNTDEFPNDVNEWIDSDNDGVGDNTDEFPNDPFETKDFDGDGYGGNIDYYPNDKNRWEENNAPVIERMEINQLYLGNAESHESTYQFVVFYKNSDGERENLEEKWDFGDGFGGYGYPVHTYRHSGYYDVVVTVTGSKGGITTKTERFYVDKIGVNIEEWGDLLLTPMISGDVDNVKFLHLFLIDADTYWIFNGDLINIEDKVYDLVRLEIKFLDNDNNYLISKVITNFHLDIGENWHFSENIYQKLDINSFKIHIILI